MSFDVALRFMVQGAGASASEIDKVDKALGRTTTAAKGATSQLGALGGALSALVGGAVAFELVQMADAVTTLTNRLRLATGSASTAADVYERLFTVAQQSRTSFTELGATYSTLARAGSQMGVSQTRLLSVTEAIGNAMAISGGSAEGMRAALVQLGQGMSAGALRGEELNSVMEQAPRLAQALADGLGVPIGQLRRLGEEGALTAERVMTALETAAPQLAKEVAQSGMTVSQAYQVLQNSITRFVGEADKATGASSALAKAMQALGGAIDATGSFIKTHEQAFGLIGGALAGAAAVAGVMALASALGAVKVAVVALSAVLSGPVLALLGIGVVVGGAAAAVSAYGKTAEGIRSTIEALREANELSQKALDNAAGRGAAQANIRATMQQRLDDISKLQAALAQLDAKDLDTRAEDARLGRSTAAYSEQQTVLANLATIKSKLVGLDDKHVLTLQQLAAARNADAISVDEYLQLVRKSISDTDQSKEAAKNAERQRDLLAELSGYTKDYERDVNDLVAARRAGLITEEAYLKLVRELVGKQPAVADALRRENELLATRNKLLQQAQDEVDDYLANQLQATGRDAEAAEKALQAAKDEYAQFGLLKSQVASLTLLRLRDKQQQFETGSANYATVQREIDAQEQLVDVLRRGEAREQSIAAAKEAASYWRSAADSIYSSLSDALMRAFDDGRAGGASLVDSLKASFKNLVLKVAVDSVMSPVRSTVDSLLGLTRSGDKGGTSSEALNGLGNTVASAIMRSASMIWGQAGGYGAAIGTTNIGAGSQAAMLAEQTGVFGAEGMSATAAAAGSAGVAGIGSAISAAMPYAAVVAAGLKLAMKDQKQGFNARAAREAGDGFGGIVGAGTVFAETSRLLQKLGMNERWADILSQSTGFAKLFGRAMPKAIDQGIVGSFGGGEADVQAFQDWKARGGLFRSNRTGTNYAPLQDAQVAVLSGYAKEAMESVKGWAEVLQLPVDSLASVSKEFRLSLGADDAANQKAVEAVVKQYREALAEQYAEAVKPLQRFGESTTEALQRLVGLQTFSKSLNELGGIFARVAGLSVDAREAIIDLAGGMDALSQKATSFAQDYYSRDEIAGIKAREVQTNLAAVGITQDLSSKAQFRALVESLDPSSDQGQRQLVALLDAAPVFSDIADYLEEIGAGSLASTAAQAPSQGTVASLFAQADPAQLDAINSVRDSVNAMADRVVEAIEARGRWIVTGTGDAEGGYYEGEVTAPNDNYGGGL